MTVARQDAQIEDCTSLEAPVDLAHLRRYTCGDRALEGEILALFAEQLPLLIERLRAAGDQRDWRIASHTLKGSCRAIGAWHLGGLAEAIELIDALPPPHQRDGLLAHVRVAANELAEFLQLPRCSA